MDFDKKRSCESQLITTCRDFVNTIKNNSHIDAILLDFSKAFDKVHHKSLLKKTDHHILETTLSDGCNPLFREGSRPQ